MSMTSFAERLRETRASKGLSQNALADQAGISQSTIANIESGRNLGSKNLLQIAKVLETNPEWLLTGEGPKEPTERGNAFALAFTEATERNLNDPEYIERRRLLMRYARSTSSIPIFEFQTHPSTGHPQALLNHGKTYFAYGVDRALENCKALYVPDASMEPFVFAKDLVVIDTSRTRPQEAGIYAMMFAGDLLIRQIFKQPAGTLVLHAYNDKYPDKVVQGSSDSSELAILGEVFHRSPKTFEL